MLIIRSYIGITIFLKKTSLHQRIGLITRISLNQKLFNFILKRHKSNHLQFSIISIQLPTLQSRKSEVKILILFITENKTITQWTIESIDSVYTIVIDC